MKNATFTPGPWRVHAERWVKATRGDHEGEILVAPTYWMEHVAEEAAANARLIAAAPELLEAVRDLDDAICANLDQQVNRTALRLALIKGRAAIAKATGAAP
jgi:hypothetical protein